MNIFNGILFDINSKDIIDGKLIIPEGVVEIADNAISSNENIEFVVFPNTLKKINEHAFAFCKNLLRVTFSNSIEEIGEKAFYDCENLEQPILPSGLKILGSDAFSACNFDELIIPKGIEEVQISNELPFYFFDKRQSGIAYTKYENNNSYNIYNLPIASEYFLSNYDNFNKNLSDLNNKSIVKLYDYLNNLPSEDLQDFVKNHNFTFFKKFQNKYDYNVNGFFQLYYNLGGFSKPINRNGKNIDYAQKIGEFFLLTLDKQLIPITLLGKIGDGMRDFNFNPDFTNFFLENFNELVEIENKNYGFISNCYNNFDDIQKTNTSNRGSQRQLKPTVQKFFNYLNKDKFKNVTPENKYIADTLSPFFNEQTLFDDAIKINEERIKNKTPNNILNFHLTEKSAFEKIEGYASSIKNLQSEFLKNMGVIANNEFTFDWLEKNDPQNFILGKYCSCCAHIDGAGYGIMKASIVHPRVQNLVIKDKFNNIIAKSTLYLNSKYGYGVFNNVEVNEGISDNDRKLIYQKYIEAIDIFAKEYNLEHPNNNLKVITVGMHSNDLMQYFIKYNKRKLRLLPALKYGSFCPSGEGYNGDSDEIQYVVWKNPTLNSSKDQNNLNAELEK